MLYVGIQRPLSVRVHATQKDVDHNQKELLQSRGLTPLQDGESHKIALLQDPDDILNFWETIEIVGESPHKRIYHHIMIGQSGQRRFMASVVDLSTNEVKVWKFGLMLSEIVMGIEKAITDWNPGDRITGQVMRLSREGKGIRTRYRLILLDETIPHLDYEPIDIISALIYKGD